MSPPAPGPGEPDPPGAGPDGPDPAGSRPDGTGPGGGSGRRWVPFGYLFALYFILGGSETMISPLFPLVRVDLGLDESHQAAILAAVAAGIASFNLIGGAASRRLTDRALVRSAAACLAGGMVLSGAAPSFWPLLAGQALLGVAFGIFFPPALAVVARLYPAAVGKAIAAYGAGLLLRAGRGRPHRQRGRRQLALGVLRLRPARAGGRVVDAGLARARPRPGPAPALGPDPPVRPDAGAAPVRAGQLRGRVHALRGDRLRPRLLRGPGHPPSG